MCVNVTENVSFYCNVNGQYLDCGGQWGYSRRSVSGKKLTTSPGMWTVEDPRRKMDAPRRCAFEEGERRSEGRKKEYSGWTGEFFLLLKGLDLRGTIECYCSILSLANVQLKQNVGYFCLFICCLFLRVLCEPVAYKQTLSGAVGSMQSRVYSVCVSPPLLVVLGTHSVTHMFV